MAKRTRETKSETPAPETVAEGASAAAPTPGGWSVLRSRAERWDVLLLSALAAVVFFPYLGAVGFWDPWEAQYDEVARSMIAREDYVHPYYREAYFFSKPALSLWLMAIGQLLAGVNDPARGTAVYTEWCVRSIFALVAILGIVAVYLAASRTISRRVGVWSAVILATSPMYFLLARQAMVDMPFVAMLTCAVAALAIAVFEKERVQDGWLYAFYAFVGLAVLAKGFIGIALPGAAMLLYLVLTGDWRLLARLRIPTGALVTFAVAGPWLLSMIGFRGVDDESKTFFQRFIIHDHFKRLGVDPTKGQLIGGVHTTTPNPSFVYYFEQLGYGLFPWVAAVPGALALLFRRRPPMLTRAQRAKLFVACWAFTSFAFFAFTATKFHHYIFPAVPPIAILLAVWIDDLVETGLGANVLALLGGLVLFGLVAQNLATDAKPLVNLFVYNYERPYPSREVNPQQTFIVIFVLFVALPALALLFGPGLRQALAKRLRDGRARVDAFLSDGQLVASALATVALVFAVYVSAYHWRKLTPHWTQRDLFWTYHQESTPDEPIAAYQMNWHGETFYSRNTVRQIRDASVIRAFVAPPGREWILVEHSRLQSLKNALGSGQRVRLADRSNNKFALVAVEEASPASAPASSDLPD